MDLNASAPYEFLDLSDIDDSERKQLIRTLYKSSQEEEPSFISTKIKKKSVHGTTSSSTTIKDVHKYSRYDSSKYVKNVAVYNLPQQITTNDKTPPRHVVRNLVFPRFLTPIAVPFCALVKPTLTEVAIVPLRAPAITAGAAVRLHAEQNKAKGTLKPCVNSLSSMMAQHTPALHHQPQQQQLVSQQSQAQSHPQTQQNASQNNNLSNYSGPHPTQPHGFNPIQHGNNMYIQPHGVGGTTYMLPVAPPLSNVYVNNVTANVTMTGFVAHSGSQYLSGAAPPFIPSEHQNMPHVTEQAAQVAPQTTIVSNTRTTRRGRGRTNNGNGRRNEFHQRQQQSSPSPQEIINPPVDTQNLGGTGYPHFFQCTYPAPFYGIPQNIGPPQAQQATGTPLFVSTPVPMYQQIYPYPPVIYPHILPPDYQLLDEKDEEQQHPEGMIPHMWSGHMPMEYTEEYINHEMNADVNHNPSSITSSDTPSLLSPNYPIFEQQIPPTLEMQQQLSNMHIYDPQSLPPQTGLQSEEHQLQECQSMELPSDQMGPPLLLQTPNAAEQLQCEHDLQEQAADIENTANNNDPILTEVPCAALITDRNIPDISYVNNQSLSTQQPTNINTSMTNITNMPIVNNNETNVLKDVNENVPNVQPQQPEKVSVTTNKIENENFSVPNINSDIPINSTNRPMQWTNQQKKSTASVAVTATPSLTNKQNNKYNNMNQNVSAPQCPQVKNYGAMKTQSSPVITNDTIPEKRISQTSHSVESGKPISTASIASTVAPQQFQDNNQFQDKNIDPNVAYAMAPNKEQIKTDTENIVRTKKDEATSTSMAPPAQQASASTAQTQQQQGPASWASLFSNKSSVSSSTIISSVPSASKKPIAKVSPFEGTSNFVPPSTPGGMSYSAASAQGIPSPQSNVNAKIKSPSSSIASNFSKENVDEWSIKFADFLTKYNVDYSSVSLRPRGLTNRSNYCYINAILQAFVGCPPFYNLIKAIPKQTPAINNERTNVPTINAMMQLIAEFSHLPPGARLLSRREKGQKKDDVSGELQCDAAFEPTAIYKLWNSTRADVEGRQEDAEEFLGYVLNKLNDEMLEIIKLTAKPSVEQQQQNGDTNDGDDAEEWQMIYNNRNKGSVTRQTDFGRTPISDIFRGELRSRIQREGEHSTDVIQPFFTLQLNIEKAASVKEALEILVGRDQLEGVTCSKTNQEVVAWQQMNLEKLPVVLILHLKWFDYKLDGCTKILKTVDFPVELKVDTKILASKKYSQKQRLYRLFAVVYHDGKEASKGHYITDVFHPGYLNWLRFDDSSVKPVSENNVLRPRAPRVPYLLYYRRSDTAPAQQQQQQQQQQPHNATNSKHAHTEVRS